MRRAIIRGGEPAEEAPIQYRLVQWDKYVVLEAIVGDLTQSLLILSPHTIKKVGYVSDRIGLPTSRADKSIIIEEYD